MQKRKAKKGKKASESRLATMLISASPGAAIRQSVTIPGDLAELIERLKQQNESISKVLLRYARLGIREEERREQELRSLVRKIQAAPTPEEADRLYGDELIETVFGPQRLRAKD